MPNPKKFTLILVIALILASTVLLAAAQKDSAPKTQDRLALGEEHVKQLCLIMKSEKQGKISKQEFMKFMEAEFERLDRSKQGELDVNALVQPTITANRLVGK
jgi:hypothetical protein